MAPGAVRAPGRERTTAFWFIAIATVVGLALRLTFSLAYWVDKPLTHDELEYLTLARSLATGQGFRYPLATPQDVNLERFSRAPFYPFVLSQIGGQAVLNPNPSSVPSSIKIAQSFLGAAVIPILAAIAWRAAGPVAGAVAAVVAAVHPPLLSISAGALSESLYTVLLWLSALALGMALDRRSSASSGALGLSVAAGAIGAVAALTRPAAIMFLGLTTLWLVVRGPRRLALAFLVAAGVVIAPWTARNVREYGRIMPIAAQGGINFWIGNHPLGDGQGDMAANPRLKLADIELRRHHPGLSPEALEPIYYREALGYVAAHPVWWMGLLARKLFHLVVPVGSSYTLHSRRYQLATVLPYVALLPFAFGGLSVLLRTHAPVKAVWLAFASAVATCLIFFPQERYRVTEIDPTLIICTAAWVAAKASRNDGIVGRG